MPSFICCVLSVFTYYMYMISSPLLKLIYSNRFNYIVSLKFIAHISTYFFSQIV
jgi:hypothetical protein